MTFDFQTNGSLMVNRHSNLTDYPNSIDPVVFWCSDSSKLKFPILSLVAEKYLCTPATSSESERLFSTASNILTDQRRSLKPENLQKLLFLHHNLVLEGM
jgi:hypothetical protein